MHWSQSLCVSPIYLLTHRFRPQTHRQLQRNSFCHCLYRCQTTFNEKIAQRDANIARWQGGAKNFRPAADLLPGGAGRPKFNQLEMVTTFTYKLSLVRIDARNFELSCNRPTHTPTNTQINKQTNRTDYNTLACSVMNI